MAALPLSQTVDASSARSSWRSSAWSLATSTLLQGLALAILVVAPLTAMKSLPAPDSAVALPRFVPVVPAPPPPVATERRPPVRVSTPRAPDLRDALEEFRFPMEIPDEIPDEPVFGSGDGELGVPGGVPGGDPESVGAPIVNLPAVEPPPPLSEAVRPGGEIREPRKVHHVNPVYPKIALAARIQGTVKLETTIDTGGNVVNLRVVESIPLLDAAAVEAVRQWRYEPTYLNGRPVPVLLAVQVVFQLS